MKQTIKEHFCKFCDNIVTNKKTPLYKESWDFKDKYGKVATYEYFTCHTCGMRYTPEELK